MLKGALRSGGHGILNLRQLPRPLLPHRLRGHDGHHRPQHPLGLVVEGQADRRNSASELKQP